MELPYTWNNPAPRSCSKSLQELAEDKRLKDWMDRVAETAPLLPRWSVILQDDLARPQWRTTLWWGAVASSGGSGSNHHSVPLQSSDVRRTKKRKYKKRKKQGEVNQLKEPVTQF
ncbi:hypothetical protein NDU88_000891 [Pleurodeles waltl]|uniref:Uncharacterized protein n=1 Tax=Pleurodeles waltl TaxID=8319 RepID=A0AAV7UR81_PLEWA|nr:hypothetical protein NDU88_000891 [Pleurodeles waltl]